MARPTSPEALRSTLEALEFTNTLVESVCSDVESICSLSIQCLNSSGGVHHMTDVCRALSVARERLAELREHIKNTADAASPTSKAPQGAGGGGGIILLLKTPFKTTTKQKTQGPFGPFFAATA